MPREAVTGSFETVVALCPPDAQERLRRWSQRTINGSDRILRSYLYEDLSYESCVDRMDDVLLTEIPYLVSLEEDEEGLVGPFSVRQPWRLRIPTLSAFYQASEISPDLIALEKATGDLESLVTPSSLIPLTLQDAFGRMPKGKQSGLPMYTSEIEGLSYYYRRAETFLRDPSSEEYLWPAVAGWRGQAGGPSPSDVKQRLVWMYEKLDAILGSMFLYPILERLRRYIAFSAWSDLDTVDRAVTLLIEKAKTRGVNLYSTDYSGFDASLNLDILQRVLHACASWFSRKWKPVWDLIGDNLIHLGLLTPEGVSPRREGGMPSGTIVTGLVDTLVNFLVTRYICHRLGVKSEGVLVLGDDAVNVFYPDPGVEAIVAAAGELGLVQNESKQHVAKDTVHFLQRAHMDDYRVEGVCVGVRSIIRTLSGLVNYERPRNGWTHSMAVMRTIMQLENAKWHPDFEPFVIRVATDNRTLLTRTPENWLKSAGGIVKVLNTLGLDSFRYTSQTDIRSFRTIGILRNLR